MIMNCYALKDRLNDYSYPIPFVNHAIAQRYWADTCKQDTMQDNPGDFTFEYVGDWDSEEGKFIEPARNNRKNHICKVMVKGE